MSKNLKRIFALVLSLCLVLGATSVAFAADEEVLIASGDVNKDGTITAFDARLALRNSVGLEILDEIQTWVADADGDNTITAFDARAILRVSVGIEKFGDLTSYYDAKIIIDAIVNGLNGHKLAEKNQYLADIITAVADFAGGEVEEADLIKTVLLGLVEDMGQEDWDNANAIIKTVAPAVLKWAAAKDVAAIAALVKEEKSSNEIFEAAAKMLLTDDAINAIITSLKTNGLVKTLELGIELLDKANILEAVYDAVYALPGLSADVKAKIDTYAKAKAELKEELAYFAKVKFVKELDVIDKWLAANANKASAAEIKSFIIDLFKNEPVAPVDPTDPTDPTDPEPTENEKNVQAITDALVAKFQSKDKNQKNAYLKAAVARVADIASGRDLDANMIALAKDFIDKQIERLDDVDWTNVETAIKGILPTVLLNVADEADVATLADMFAQNAEGELAAEEIVNKVVGLVFTDKNVGIIVGALETKGLDGALLDAVALLDATHILEAVYDTLYAIPGFFDAATKAKIDTYAKAKTELENELKDLSVDTQNKPILDAVNQFLKDNASKATPEKVREKINEVLVGA